MASSGIDKDSLSDALCKFKDQFKGRLSVEQSRQFRFTTREELRSTIVEVQKQQATERRLQNMKRLKRFLDTMDSFGKVIDVFANVNEFVPFIWGPIKYFLEVSKSFTESFDALLDTYEEIGNTLPFLEQCEDLFRSCPYMRSALVFIYSDILAFHLRALECFQQKKWQKLFHANWKTFRTDVQPYIQNLKSSRRLIEDQAHLTHFKEFQKYRSDQTNKTRFDQRNEKHRRQIAVSKWLGDDDPAQSEHVDLCEIRQKSPESGRWLLEKDEFKRWFNPDVCLRPLLWMKGQPGAGKTVLASLIIEECKKVKDSTTVFFYCKHTDNKSSFAALASSLVGQAFRQNRGLLNYLYETCSESGYANLKSDDRLCYEVLKVAIGNLKNPYIVIDGMDECKERDQNKIISFFRSLAKGDFDAEIDDCESQRCLMISQHDKVSRSMLSKEPTLTISELDNLGDIKAFIRITGQEIGQEFGIAEEKILELTNQVTRISNGMFLYAKLVMENLLHQETREALQAELDDSVFPKGLEDAYDRIFQRITRGPAENSKWVWKVLGLVVCAKRSLKWREIQGAFAIDPIRRKVDFQNKRIKSNPKELCDSLLEWRPNGDVELVHATARTYLFSPDRINKYAQHLELADLCLSLLIIPGFDTDGVISDEEIQRLVQKGHYGFLDYAVSFWSSHTKSCIFNCEELPNIEQFVETVGVFLELHYHPPRGKFTADEKLKSQVRGSLGEWEWAGELANSIAATRKQRESQGAESAQNEVLNIPGILQRVRNAQEGAASTTTDFYGNSVFKCTRMSCSFFYEGFPSYDRRQTHVEKHEKPYRCTYPDCRFADVGFGTKPELRSHLKRLHNEQLWDEDEFPPRRVKIQLIEEDEEEHEPEPQEKVHPSKHSCEICGKTFTRLTNLQGHENSHRGHRPNKCSVCGWGFARRSDCNRHEALHSEKKKLVCIGKLGDQRYGDQFWGCQQEFRRAHKLAQHYIFEEEGSGRKACIEPLVERCHDPNAGGANGKYICRGKLHSAKETIYWGCERRFNTSKTLKKHWKHSKGRTGCLKFILLGKEDIPASEFDSQTDGNQDDSASAVGQRDMGADTGDDGIHDVDDHFPAKEGFQNVDDQIILPSHDDVQLPPLQQSQNTMESLPSFDQYFGDYTQDTITPDFTGNLSQGNFPSPTGAIAHDDLLDGFNFDSFLQADAITNGWMDPPTYDRQ